MIETTQEVKKFFVDDPSIDYGYTERFEVLKKQILGFVAKSEYQYPFIVTSKNEQWNEIMGNGKSEVEIKNYFDIEYFALQYVCVYCVEESIHYDWAFENLDLISSAGALYEEFCYRKDSISFFSFYEIYRDNHVRLKQLIR
jgi:hypothetical protein